MKDIGECVRHRHFKVEDDKAYCTHITGKCPHQDYSRTRACRMYSSIDGWSDEIIPLCSHPDITDRIMQDEAYVPHDLDVMPRMRKV
jgi:hypothetical protein